MGGDGRVDQTTPQRAYARQRPLLVDAGPTIFKPPDCFKRSRVPRLGLRQPIFLFAQTPQRPCPVSFSGGAIAVSGQRPGLAPRFYPNTDRSCSDARSLVPGMTLRPSGSHPFQAWLPPSSARADGPVQLPIIDLALSGVIAVVGTVTVVGTLSAQSSRIDFAMSIACGPPVG